MAKTSGMGENFYVGEYNISGDIGSLSRISTPKEQLIVTDITQSAVDRLDGRRDGAIDFMAYFDTAAGASHPVLSALPTTDVICSYFFKTTLGNPAMSMIGKQIDYAPQRGTDGSLTFNVSALANAFGAEWGLMHTAGVRTDTDETDGTGVDGGAASSFGLQAYLHVFTFEGTDATVKIQESSDNDLDAYVDVVGGGFTAVTEATSERIATTTDLAVEQYLRVITTTVGGFTSMTFAVNIVRNTLAPIF